MRAKYIIRKRGVGSLVREVGFNENYALEGSPSLKYVYTSMYSQSVDQLGLPAYLGYMCKKNGVRIHTRSLVSVVCGLIIPRMTGIDSLLALEKKRGKWLVLVMSCNCISIQPYPTHRWGRMHRKKEPIDCVLHLTHMYFIPASAVVIYVLCMSDGPV